MSSASAKMSGLSILPDQVYGEESFESPSRSRGAGGGGGGTKMPAASGQSYEEDDLGTSSSLSGCSSSGYEFHEDDDDAYPLDHVRDGGGSDRYGREMRSLLKSLEDAIDDSDFIASGRASSGRDRRRKKRGDRDRGFISPNHDWLIRPEFFCQYPRLMAAASKGSRAGASTLRRPPPPQSSLHRSTSADRAFVLPMHRAAGGLAGRANKWKIKHSSVAGDAAASGEETRDGGRRENICREGRGHKRSGKE